jgi:DNA polymerase epsilon subunit 3
MAGKTHELQLTAKEEGPKAMPAPAAAMMEAEVEELPKAIMWWLVKDKLVRVAVTGKGEGGGQRCGGQGRHVRFHHSACFFIHYLSTKYVPPGMNLLVPF